MLFRSGGFSGSGGSSSSGFSLGEGHNASSADTALKNILNGDSPVGGDPSLAALSEGGGDAKGDSNLLSLDPDNIFARVKSTHHRCQKRGWVGEKSSGSI